LTINPGHFVFRHGIRLLTPLIKNED
jgi:hypothetical protein